MDNPTWLIDVRISSKGRQASDRGKMYRKSLSRRRRPCVRIHKAPRRSGQVLTKGSAIALHDDEVCGMLQRLEHLAETFSHFLPLATEDTVIAQAVDAASGDAATLRTRRKLNQSGPYFFPP